MLGVLMVLCLGALLLTNERIRNRLSSLFSNRRALNPDEKGQRDVSDE